MERYTYQLVDNIGCLATVVAGDLDAALDLLYFKDRQILFVFAGMAVFKELNHGYTFGVLWKAA